MTLIYQSLGTLAKLSVVVAINLSLFLVIPVTENLFKLIDVSEKKAEESKKKVVAEYVRPKPKKTPQPKQSRIRTVSNASSRPVQSTMKFKFSPDLSVGGAGDGVAMQSQELQAEVFEEGEVDVDAVPVYTPPPSYPKRARQLAVEGEATAVFVVDVDGRVSSIDRIEAPHQILEQEIRNTIGQWKFKPAQNRGVPVKTRISIPFTFSLDS